jgi:hypothetical protein
MWIRNQAQVPLELRQRQKGEEMTASPGGQSGIRQTRDAREDAMWMLDGRPDAREAIRRRLAEVPEYRIWLERSGNGVLRALDGNA